LSLQSLQTTWCGRRPSRRAFAVCDSCAAALGRLNSTGAFTSAVTISAAGAAAAAAGEVTPAPGADGRLGLERVEAAPAAAAAAS
jgi:hypothetical protein